jgi:SAM-dependent methyltransferase
VSERAGCIVCAGARATPFLRIEHVPVSCNHLCSSRDAALSEPRAAICLGFCPDCGHIFNMEYDPTQLSYRVGYENSLRGSDRFRKYEDALVDTLLERYQLHERIIVEIGCGRGQFLRALCERGGNSGIGFDPSYSGEEENAKGSPDIVIRPEAYGAQNKDLNADFICSRQTLEHLYDPRGFLSNIRNATSRSGIPVFLEVPNGLYTLHDEGIWDVIYEHCSYFTPCSLARVFGETGYKLVEVAETFSAQFLIVHAETNASERGPTTAVTLDLERMVGSFAERYEKRLRDWICRLLELENEGRKVVVWGAGSKATTFLNLLRPRAIEFVVDVNPRKHWKYVIGTGQRIVPPEFLREYVPDDVICMNPNYLDEIADQMHTLGIPANLVSA